MILLIDNYDSFTYNLYHYLIQSGEKNVVVKRNDEISILQLGSFIGRSTNSSCFC